MGKTKTVIPTDTAAKILFLHDRTCCVCRQEGKKVQIHHIDEDPSNNLENNLAVLCFECHTETMIKGGFHRKLDGDQIILYRNDWLNVVTRKRSLEEIKDRTINHINPLDLELATGIAEIYRENNEIELLAIHYDLIGNYELRDKYIMKVLAKNPSDDTYVFLKIIQEKCSEIPKEVIDRYIAKLNTNKNWLFLARIYRYIDKPKESLKYYLKGISEAFREKNNFTTAYYLRELASTEISEQLFRSTLNESKHNRDLWWQVRSLQELGWNTELDSFIRENKTQILASNDLNLIKLLARVEGNNKQYRDIVLKEAKTKHLFADANIKVTKQDN